ncbi:MAG: dihydroneopterin aldolase [Brumimicrobium sp.]|nr:dihydroneopterin aldolase [Brumimicrobium sp.]MCO5267374.1 dihydroneopterin aldolase [Brumimicrobium sp.]
MQHTIEVNGIQLYAYHGCMPEEERIGGRYTVDVSVSTNFNTCFQTDEVSDTVDYVTINKIVTEEMAIRSKLIEHVGNRIHQRIHKEIKGVIGVKVKVIKHTPPIGGNVENVAIILED